MPWSAAKMTCHPAGVRTIAGVDTSYGEPAHARRRPHDLPRTSNQRVREGRGHKPVSLHSRAPLLPRGSAGHRGARKTARAARPFALPCPGLRPSAPLRTRLSPRRVPGFARHRLCQNPARRHARRAGHATTGSTPRPPSPSCCAASAATASPSLPVPRIAWPRCPSARPPCPGQGCVSAATSGTVNANVVSSGWSLSTQMWPPWRSTISRATKSPTPSPMPEPLWTWRPGTR